MSRLRRVLFAAVALVVLAGCKLDVAVGVTVNADGSGGVAVTATVDADVVAQTPGLRSALVLPDAAAARWTVEGPTDSESGGLTLTLRHDFTTVEEATNLLRSLGPPFNADIALSRTATNDEVTVDLVGTMSLAGGTFEAFSDDGLTAAVGGLPFGTALTASGATPADSMTVKFALTLPGEITTTTGSRGGDSDSTVTWDVKLDGSATDLATTSVLRSGGGGAGWAKPVAMIALVAMIAWLLAGGYLAWRVRQARARRSRGRFANW